MSIADELRKLQELHADGSLTDEEYATAKASVLADQPNSKPAEVLEEHLESIKLQNDIAQLDREWAIQRERFMVSGRHGIRYLPTKGNSLMGGFIIGVIGMIWTVIAIQMGGYGFLPAIGLLVLLVGVGQSLYAFMKAEEYSKAYAQYQRRRTDLVNRQDESE